MKTIAVLMAIAAALAMTGNALPLRNESYPEYPSDPDDQEPEEVPTEVPAQGYALQAFNSPVCSGNEGKEKHFHPGVQKKIGVRTPFFGWPPMAMIARQSVKLDGPAYIQACKGPPRTRHFKHCVDLGAQPAHACVRIDRADLGVNWIPKTILVTGIDDHGAALVRVRQHDYQGPDRDDWGELLTSSAAAPAGTPSPSQPGGDPNVDLPDRSDPSYPDGPYPGGPGQSFPDPGPDVPDPLNAGLFTYPRFGGSGSGESDADES